MCNFEKSNLLWVGCKASKIAFNYDLDVKNAKPKKHEKNQNQLKSVIVFIGKVNHLSNEDIRPNVTNLSHCSKCKLRSSQKNENENENENVCHLFGLDVEKLIYSNNSWLIFE